MAVHVLGIETSCDDTGVAILRQDGKILSNCLDSQLKQHLHHGGIIPMVAREYHINNIDRVARRAFNESGLQSVNRDISAIAVTTRPGMNYSLEVGLNYARELAKKYSKPLIPIHHMQAHALMPLLENRSIKFPFLALLISGGHCLLSICERIDKFYLLGKSDDGSPGELLDKIARRLRLRNLGEPYDNLSGGAAIELLSNRSTANRFKYFDTEKAVPMISLPNCDFSFSGYWGNFNKFVSSIDDLWQSGQDKDFLLDELSHVCGSIQRAIAIQLFRKLRRAMSYYRMYWRYENPQAFLTDKGPTKHLGFDIREFREQSDYLDVVVSGGVAANNYIINCLKSACASDIDADLKVYRPTKMLCSDNGLMIAWNGLLKHQSYLKNSDQMLNEFKTEKEARNNSIISCSSQMDQLKTIATSDIGEDLRDKVKNAQFSLPRVLSRELKIGPSGKKLDLID